mgnify:CR=1 FL=1
MDKKNKLRIFFIFFISFLTFLNASIKKLDYWKEWLNEVHLIITEAEKAVFESLEKEEDMKKFQELFWKVRDPKPETPYNEYKMEFHRRLQYAKTRLEGPDLDRGRIYILLGEPQEIKNYSGSEEVVDCELWIYKSEGRPGLPPFMYLLFYKPNDFGNFRQFQPGPNSALDIISPTYSLGTTSKYEAYYIIRRSFPELAGATLSITPGESNPMMGQSLTSSGYVLAHIYSLPEREVEKNYLRKFESINGKVDVTYSERGIGGEGFISISENRGFRLLNYSIMPEIIHMSKGADNLYTANININLRIEDLEGNTIHQQERNINLEFDEAKKKNMVDQRKIVFKDFTPIIEGEFNVSITFYNRTMEEFFVYKERINIIDNTVPVLIGFKIKGLNIDKFIPFSTGKYKVFSDPRFIFSKLDSIEGLIFTEQRPTIYLVSIEDENKFIEIKDVVKNGNFFIFKQPLIDIKSDYYYLSIKNEENEIYSKTISVLPFDIDHPVDFERSEVTSSNFNYIFILAQQYLNKVDVDMALEYFNKLPENLWNSTTIPIIAQAYYIKKDYGKVVELLEKENIVKNYSVLLLLANSSLELKKLEKAAEYFEFLRKYRNTIKINRILGAIYYSLGEREKAKIYWERAKSLEKEEKLGKNKEK